VVDVLSLWEDETELIIDGKFPQGVDNEVNQDMACRALSRVMINQTQCNGESASRFKTFLLAEFCWEIATIWKLSS